MNKLRQSDLLTALPKILTHCVLGIVFAPSLLTSHRSRKELDHKATAEREANLWSTNSPFSALPHLSFQTRTNASDFPSIFLPIGLTTEH
ncbi:unnamed protein product [Clonostachys rhizophaga]|uniref:Uncharacterized protein n=1 Tax=Clonostachys rhizophaga TaxID=160324 RepID=A0A9N9VQK5_9HYPO|nr:unnamed protein product [Clonostachys rhizophaga]